MNLRSHSPGGTGRIVPDATLAVVGGGSVTLSDFRPRWDLVLILLGDTPPGPDVERLLDTLAAERGEVEAEDGKVLVVTTRPFTPWRWPFPLLLDPEGALHRRTDAVDRAGRPAPAMYITDHYREIYGAMQPGQDTWPETARDVIEWLVFANIQCPECNAPECEW